MLSASTAEQLAVDAAEAVSTADQNRLEVSRVLTLAAESALEDIDAALQRLEQGAYGICERCAEPIPWERLEVLPMTRLCTPVSTSPSLIVPRDPVKQR